MANSTFYWSKSHYPPPLLYNSDIMILLSLSFVIFFPVGTYNALRQKARIAYMPMNRNLNVEF